MSSPSRLRKEGRRAFSPGCDPDDYCPYEKKDYNYEFKMNHFLEGWKEAEEDHKDMIKEEEEKESIFSAISCSCPWNSEDGNCKATNELCEIENCAFVYFHENGL